MSYDAADLSVSAGKPTELYRFAAENLEWRYTDAPTPQTAEGVAWNPRQIHRTAINRNLDINTAQKTTVFLPLSDALSRRVIGLITPTTFTVDILQRHRDDPDGETKRILSGYVVEIDTVGKELKLSVVNLFASYLTGDVVTEKYSQQCNHDFGDEHCQVNADAYAVTRTVQSFDTYALTTSATIPDVAKFLGGDMLNLRTGQKRPILRQANNNRFASVAPWFDIQVGDQIKFTPSCDHSLLGPKGCGTLYNNAINFGGFPLIPRTNPFLQGLGEPKYSFYEGTPS